MRAADPEVVIGLIDEARRRGLPVLAAAIVVSATTGLRRRELWGLRWSDVDLDNATLTVARAVKHNDGPGWVVGDTKTHRVRRIALDSETISVLGRHRALMNRAGQAAQVRMQPEGFVFTLDPTGASTWKPDPYTQGLRSLVFPVVSGLPRKASGYTLRKPARVSAGSSDSMSSSKSFGTSRSPRR